MENPSHRTVGYIQICVYYMCLFLSFLFFFSAKGTLLDNTEPVLCPLQRLGECVTHLLSHSAFLPSLTHFSPPPLFPCDMSMFFGVVEGEKTPAVAKAGIPSSSSLKTLYQHISSCVCILFVFIYLFKTRVRESKTYRHTKSKQISFPCIYKVCFCSKHLNGWVI